MVVNSGLPLVRIFGLNAAPEINGDITITLRQYCGKPPIYKIEGQHDGFPSHEVYINQTAVHLYDPLVTGNTPLSLFGVGAGEWSIPDKGFRLVPNNQ